jgi:DoxX-like protein
LSFDNVVEVVMKRWAGIVIGAWVVLFLTFDAAVKLLGLDVAVEGTTRLGYPASLVVTIGWVELVCLLAYVIPRSAPIGALLLTGYLGGATATQVRVEDPWFLFPVGVGVLLWGALWLRDPRIGTIFFGTSTHCEDDVTPQLVGSVPRPS